MILSEMFECVFLWRRDYSAWDRFSQLDGIPAALQGDRVLLMKRQGVRYCRDWEKWVGVATRRLGLPGDVEAEEIANN